MMEDFKMDLDKIFESVLNRYSNDSEIKIKVEEYSKFDTDRLFQKYQYAIENKYIKDAIALRLTLLNKGFDIDGLQAYADTQK